jgi:hypothetical protein
MRKILVALAMLPTMAISAPIADFQFKSPAFNGSGYSSHVLTIENQEQTRKKALEKDIQAELDKKKSDAENTNVKKFLNNLESRIYAQISQNLATSMFANSGSCSSSTSSLTSPCGSFDFESNNITWYKNLDGIVMQVTDVAGNKTSVTIPLNSFQFGN